MKIKCDECHQYHGGFHLCIGRDGAAKLLRAQYPKQKKSFFSMDRVRKE